MPSSLKSVERAGAGPPVHHGSGSRLRFADEVVAEEAAVQRSAVSASAVVGMQRPSHLLTSSLTQSLGTAQRPAGAVTSTSAALAMRLAVMNDAGKDDGDRANQPRNIWEAAERGMTGSIVRLVERNIDFNINQRDKLLRTALHWAVECNHKDTVECLLDYNADVTATECNGRTVVHLASRAGLPDMLSVLLETLTSELRETMCNQADQFGITPVFMAYQKGDDGRRAFDVLVANGGRYNQKTTSTAVQAPAAQAAAAAVQAASQDAGSGGGVGSRIDALRQQQTKAAGQTSSI